MLVGAARTRAPRPAAPVVTARAAVGLRFRQVRFGVHSHLPFTNDLYESRRPPPSIAVPGKTNWQRCITGPLPPAKLGIFQ
jgi:hypothetical protein